jgi:hypothetical protein
MVSKEDREAKATVWLQRLQEAAASKESLVDYTRRHGLKPGEAYRWKKELRRDGRWPAYASAAAKVHRSTKGSRTAPPRFARVRIAARQPAVFLHISRARTRLQHVLLTHYLTLYFPEFERFWTTQRNEWFIQLLMLFPTPASITAVGLSGFREAIWKPMGRRVHKEAKIAEIYALAERSIALPMSAGSPAVTTFRVQLQRYLQLSEAKTAMERQADELLADRADFQCLKTIPGIGSVIALVILAEAGDLRRFPHHRQFLKFCGLDLAKSQSGNFRGKDKLSKRGNARLRCALWMAAMSAARMRENAFRDKYTRYTAGAPDDTDLKRKARTAITAKMARVVYALVKHGQPYRQRFDVDLPSGSIPLKGAVEAFGTS